MTGPAEREWDRLARRYAGVCRVVAAAGCGSLGLLLVPGRERLPAGAATAGLILWTCGFALLIQRTPAWWPVLLDLAFLSVFTVSQVANVPAASTSDGSGWVLALLSMAVVTYQWHTPVRLGALAAVVLVCAYLIGTEPAVLAAHSHDEAWLTTALWMLVEATLSRSLCVLIRRGGKIADQALAEREKTRLAGAISRARRSDELAYLADLHDTAAATFLMIGSAAFTAQASWPADQVAEQALRDLRVLRGDRHPAERAKARGVVDLAALVTALLPEVDLSVSHDLGESSSQREVSLPAAPAEAIRDCVREALTNVARHAGTGSASLSARTELGRVVVEIADRGRGFDPDRVSGQRRGIRESITARMHRAGGRASVTSAPGQGAVVRLEWPDVEWPDVEWPDVEWPDD